MKSGLIITAILILLILVISYNPKNTHILSNFKLNNDNKPVCSTDSHLLNYRTNLPMRYYYHTINPGNYNWMFQSSKVDGGNVRAGQET